MKVVIVIGFFVTLTTAATLTDITQGMGKALKLYEESKEFIDRVRTYFSSSPKVVKNWNRNDYFNCAPITYEKHVMCVDSCDYGQEIYRWCNTKVVAGPAKNERGWHYCQCVFKKGMKAFILDAKKAMMSGEAKVTDEKNEHWQWIIISLTCAFTAIIFFCCVAKCLCDCCCGYESGYGSPPSNTPPTTNVPANGSTHSSASSDDLQPSV